MKLILSMSAIGDDIYAIAKSDEHKYVSKEVAGYIKNTIAGIFSRFPYAKSKFKGVRYTKRLTSSLDPFDRCLRISIMSTGGSLAEAQLQESKGNRVGFLVHNGPNEAFTALIVHETAHFIDLSVKLKHSGDDDTLVAYQSAKRELRKQVGNPSEYAATNEGEWFAEQFTQEYLGSSGNGPLMSLVKKFMD